MVVGSLVRRGVEVASEQLSKDPSKQPEISGWLIALLAFTCLSFMFLIWSVDYTYGEVVATLAAVEDSHPDLYVPINTEFDANKPIDPNEPEIAGIPRRAITSKLRTAVEHLRARAGFWSRFRGLSIFMVYSLLRGFVTALVPVRMDNFAGQLAAQTVAGVVLASFQLAWVHIVISEPSPKRWYQRMPGYKGWAKFAPVVVFEHAITGAAFYIPLAIASAFGADVFNFPTDEPVASTVSCAALLLAVPSLLCLAVSIPARAISVRVAASMLPEEDESIVPFDRSFGGKVTPAILGGSGKLSIRDAWSTFEWSGRVRYAKVVLKVFAIEFALTVFFVMALVGELSLLGPDTIKKMAGSMHGDKGA